MTKHLSLATIGGSVASRGFVAGFKRGIKNRIRRIDPPNAIRNIRSWGHRGCKSRYDLVLGMQSSHLVERMCVRFVYYLTKRLIDTWLDNWSAVTFARSLKMYLGQESNWINVQLTTWNFLTLNVLLRLALVNRTRTDRC